MFEAALSIKSQPSTIDTLANFIKICPPTQKVCDNSLEAKGRIMRNRTTETEPESYKSLPAHL